MNFQDIFKQTVALQTISTNDTNNPANNTVETMVASRLILKKRISNTFFIDRTLPIFLHFYSILMKKKTEIRQA